VQTCASLICKQCFDSQRMSLRLAIIGSTRRGRHYACSRNHLGDTDLEIRLCRTESPCGLAGYGSVSRLWHVASGHRMGQ